MFLGERIKNERQLRKLTILDVASDSGISESQLYKIENNKINITNSTLLKLATYYGYDILDNYESLIEKDVVLILELINKDIRDRNIINIKKSLEIINYINSRSTNIMIKSICKQYYYLINGLIGLSANNYSLARESFLKGIRLFNPFINTYTFNNIGSSSIQLRLLMAYAITFRMEQDYEKCLHLLNKVISNSNNNDFMLKKTTYNIANIYSLIGKYDKSIDILDNYLNSEHLDINIHYQNIIYFKKATVSYRIGHNDYYKYALKCLYASVLSKDIKNGLVFLNVFNNLFDTPIMTREIFLNL